jgi:hypothetical protein
MLVEYESTFRGKLRVEKEKKSMEIVSIVSSIMEQF